MKKIKVDLIKNIEIVYDEEFYYKVAKISYDKIDDLLLRVEISKFYDCVNNHYSDKEEYEIKYIGEITINKDGLDIETKKQLTGISEFAKMLSIEINYHDNTSTLYNIKTIVDEENFVVEYPSVYETEKSIRLSFVYDCATYKKVGATNG